jgi:hypothetical protein
MTYDAAQAKKERELGGYCENRVDCPKSNGCNNWEHLRCDDYPRQSFSRFRARRGMK